MRCLCGGHFPPIEQQARTLHDEPGAPEWSLQVYERWCVAINEVLLQILVTHWQRRHQSKHEPEGKNQ